MLYFLAIWYNESPLLTIYITLPSFILGTFILYPILNIFDDKLLKDDRYHSLKPTEVVNIVKEYFSDLESIKELFSNKYIRLDEEVNYTYGDIMSMFLKEGVQEEGFSNPLFKEFLRVRLEDFNPEFIERHELSSERYREKYIREIKVLRK